jgi:hypothetical protein
LWYRRSWVRTPSVAPCAPITKPLWTLLPWAGVNAKAGNVTYESLDHWPFVLAAYAIGVGATLALVAWSWLAMRRAERRRDRSRDRSREK